MLLADLRRLIRKTSQVPRAKLFAHQGWFLGVFASSFPTTWRWSDVTGSPKRRGLVSAQESVPWRKTCVVRVPFHSPLEFSSLAFSPLAQPPQLSRRGKPRRSSAAARRRLRWAQSSRPTCRLRPWLLQERNSTLPSEGTVSALWRGSI